MVSFQHKLAAGLEKRGLQVCYDLREQPYAAVLVIGGTRALGALWQARRRGVRVVQRLDGMNWLHRLPSQEGKARPSLRHYLRSEYGNWLLALIRLRLADHIVYQSGFSQRWWESARGVTPVASQVIFNGVDLETYTPDGPDQRPADRHRLLLVEGSLMGGYELGLSVAVQLANALATRLKEPGDPPGGVRQVELMVAGRVSEQVRASWDSKAITPLHWAGLARREQIPAIDRSAHLLYSADINAACPNAVIEALACGLPVLAFDTGALPEMVAEAAGKVVPYGGDPWRLDPPDIPALAQAALEVLADQPRFRQGARQRAEAVFGLDQMVEAYLDALLGGG
jgi:glycosyltransferase involved in cell wall biosynthesis